MSERLHEQGPPARMICSQQPKRIEVSDDANGEGLTLETSTSRGIGEVSEIVEKRVRAKHGEGSGEERAESTRTTYADVDRTGRRGRLPEDRDCLRVVVVRASEVHASQAKLGEDMGELLSLEHDGGDHFERLRKRVSSGKVGERKQEREIETRFESLDSTASPTTRAVRAR